MNELNSTNPLTTRNFLKTTRFHKLVNKSLQTVRRIDTPSFFFADENFVFCFDRERNFKFAKNEKKFKIAEKQKKGLFQLICFFLLSPFVLSLERVTKIKVN